MGEKCFNHPDRESIAPCHSCGKYFCRDCLSEGKEYYYCKKEQCQALLKQESSQFEVAERERAVVSERRWKESSRRFYRKTGLILCISWIPLTIFLFLMVPSYNEQTAYWLPIISLLVCVKWFILIWLFRITIYKHFIWERRISKEFAADRQ